MKNLIFLILKFIPANIAYAHCDIPCGVYDPNNAQMAAHTVLRMTQLLIDLPRQDETKAEHDLARITHIKEQHGELVEEELGTLENDYFKEEHFNKFPNLKKLIEKAIKLSIKTRQTIDVAACNEMIETVMQIAEIFYKTKNLKPVRVSSGYPTEGKIVTHK